MTFINAFWNKNSFQYTEISKKKSYYIQNEISYLNLL